MNRDDSAPGRSRPHTGRRRNEAARAAVLQAAITLLSRGDRSALTMEALARQAHVGKATIYRWWPSRGAVLLEAMVEYAAEQVPDPDSGDLVNDLRLFLLRTFRVARVKPAQAVLRQSMAEALTDPVAGEAMARFAAARRAVLHDILNRARSRGELPAEFDADLCVDQCFGVLWYRLLFAHAPLSDADARGLANQIALQARPAT